MQYPLFTVIIPQKDRAQYLTHTLRTCMIQDYPNFEIIVGDDCSEDNSVEIVKELQKKDPRIKLIAHDHHVGMRENFESVLNEVKEGYVIALGGDDGLVPGCIWRMYEIITETGTQLLTWNAPSFIYPKGEGTHAMMTVFKEKFKGYKRVKSEDFLNKIAKSLHYLSSDCPMFYVQGVASMEIVKRVKQRTPDHCFYYCPTPDGFSGVVLAGEVEEYIYASEPLSISGRTVQSQGTSYRRTDAESRKAAQQFFEDSSRKTMHHELASQPYSPLITLMTADYLLTARDLPGWPGRFEMFSWEHLIRKTFQFLETSSYSNDVLTRELVILRNIAKQHDELGLFEELLKTTKRRVISNDIVDGFFITKNVYEFNASELGVNNIFDASIATPFAYRLCNRVSTKAFIRYIKRFFRISMAMMHRKVEYLPSIEPIE